MLFSRRIDRFFVVAGIGLLATVLGSPHALASTVQAVQCGDTLTASIQLDADLDCAETALTIAASDVTVDLGGHTVTGGIVAQNQTGVTIANGSVGGGVSLMNANASTLSHLHIDSYTLNGFATGLITDSVVENGQISLQGSVSLVRSSVIGVRGIAMGSGIAMADSTMTDSSFISQASAFTLTNNTLTRSRINGTESGRHVVTGNRFVQSLMSFFHADRLDIENNRFAGEGSGLGISDIIFNPSTIKGNVFDGGRIGLDIETADLARLSTIAISHNVFANNSDAGLLLAATRGPGTRAITIADNVFSSNGKASNGQVDKHGVSVDDGLHIDVPADSPVTVGDNVTLDNADHGIDAQPGTVTDGGGNISVGDPAGCLGVVCR